MSDSNQSPLAKRKAKKHTLSEGVVPYLTQKSLEELPGGKAVKAVGAAAKKALGHVYPVEGKK